jgi:hypothetical protein
MDLEKTNMALNVFRVPPIGTFFTSHRDKSPDYQIRTKLKIHGDMD